MLEINRSCDCESVIDNGKAPARNEATAMTMHRPTSKSRPPMVKVNSEPAQTQLVRRNRGGSVIAGSSARHGLFPDQRSPLSLSADGEGRDSVAEIPEATRARPDVTRRDDLLVKRRYRRGDVR